MKKKIISIILTLCLTMLTVFPSAAQSDGDIFPPGTVADTSTPATPGAPEDEEPAATPATPGAPENEEPAATPATPGAPENEEPPATPATPSTPEDEEPPATPATPGTPEDEEPAATPATPGTPDVEATPATPGIMPIQPLALAVNTTLGAVTIGDTVKINVNTRTYEFIVVHKGAPSTLYDTSFDNGVILLMKDIYEERQWHSSNVNDYANSTIHSYLNSTFLNLIDDNVRNAIVQVKIPYRPGSGTSNTINSGANGLSAKIFLLSGHELNWTHATHSYSTTNPEGATLSYFAGTSSTDAKRIAYLNDSAIRWWLRSPSTELTPNVRLVNNNGSGGGVPCSSPYGIRPALVLPNNLLVDSNGFVITNLPPTTPSSWSAQPAAAVNSWTTSSLTWTCSASTDPNGDTISYVFERSVNGGAWTSVQSSTSRSYTHNISAPNDNYVQVRVRAYDGKEYSTAYLTSSNVSITHDTVLPTIQLAVMPDTETTWVKDKATITAIVTAGVSGLKTLTAPAGVTPTGNQSLSGTSATRTFEVTANGTYSFLVTNGSGKSASASVTISKIDSDFPTITYTTDPDTGEYTNGNVVIYLTLGDAGSGLEGFNSLNGSETISGNTDTKIFTAIANGIYSFSVTDAVGHTTSVNVPVGMIDLVKPVTSMLARARQWTNAASVILDVIATDDYSGISGITLPDGSVFTGGDEATYEIFNNGAYTAYSADLAGNVSDPVTENYAWFDRTRPTIQFIKFAPTNDPVTTVAAFFANLLNIEKVVTNKTVKIEITADDTPDEGEGRSGVTHMYYRVFNQLDEVVQDWTSSPIGTAPVIGYDVNGYAEVYVMDAAGNISDVEKGDIIVDSKPPEVEVIFSTDETTHDPVDVTLRIISDDGSAPKGWILPDGGVLVPQAEITYTFSENTIKTFVAHDAAGNAREVEVRVSNIDERKVPVELWDNNQVVIDAILHAVGRRYAEDVTYNDLLKIKFIDISSYDLTSLPDVFAELKNLEHLDLRGNAFTELPNCVYQLTSLRYLDVSNNNLTDVSYYIRNLNRLETLDISLNYLVDYDCPLIVKNYRNSGNFTRSAQANQYDFNIVDYPEAEELIGNTVQINVEWYYDGQPVGRLEDHRKSLYVDMYPLYRSYRPLLFQYEVANGQPAAYTADYLQVLLTDTGVMSATLRLGG